MKIDADYIRHYVNDHKTSSVSPGVKWADLPDPDEDLGWWKQLLEHLKDIVDGPLREEGKLPAFPMNMGGRARTEQRTEKEVWTYDFESWRSRIVMFHPALSIFFVFVPDKHGFYSDCWKYCLDVMDLPPMMFPPVDGGKVYKAWGEGLKDQVDQLIVILGDDFNLIHKGEQFSWDGSNWEQFVPIILGQPWYPMFTSFGGVVALPSGVAFTTLCGTIAMAWLGKQVVEGGEKEVEGIFELEQQDIDRNFMLGLRFADDPMHPRLQGLKLSVDDATKTQRIRAGQSAELRSKYKPDESISWYNAYHGLTLSGDSLLEPFSEVDPNDWVSPGKLALKVIFNE